MTFKARVHNEESRIFWASIAQGAKIYDALPKWKKGVLNIPKEDS